MSVEATRAVWKYSEANGTTRLVLLAIADNADDAGIAWPSIKTLAAKCHVSDRAIISNIARLSSKLRELEIIRRRNRGNIYRIMLPDVSENHAAHHQQLGYKCRFCTLLNVKRSVGISEESSLNKCTPAYGNVKQGSHEPLRTINELSKNLKSDRSKTEKPKTVAKANCINCGKKLTRWGYCNKCHKFSAAEEQTA